MQNDCRSGTDARARFDAFVRLPLLGYNTIYYLYLVEENKSCSGIEDGVRPRILVYSVGHAVIRQEDMM